MLLLLAILLAVFILPAPWNYVAVIVGACLEVAETYFFVKWSKRRKTSVGVETLVGRAGVAVGDLWPVGQVKVGGEIWQARCEGGCDAGTEVVIRSVEGLMLEVEPA